MRLKEIKDTIARKHHFQDWNQMLYIFQQSGEPDLDSLIGEVVSTVLSFAADSAKTTLISVENNYHVTVDKRSIIKCIEI